MSLDFEKTYEDNMIFLQKDWNLLYHKINSADISQYELIVENDGNINVKVGNTVLYPNNSKEEIQRQVDKFLKKPRVFQKAPTMNDVLSEHEFIHNKYVLDIQNDSPYLNESRGFIGYGHNADSTFPYFLMFGVGLGYHIEYLIKHADIKHLSILDEDFSFLKLSMHIMDWRPILEYFNKENYSLYFRVTDNSDTLSKIIVNDIFANYPFYYSYIPYFMHYESDFFITLKRKYNEFIDLAITGLGFYDDEIWSLEQTIANLNTKPDIPFYKGNVKLPEDSVAFIVGSGPSLDDDIEYIKKHKDNVVVFSCGTALGSLMANGIIPDFHVEKERAQGKTRGIENMGLTEKDFEKITFIGINVIHPDVFALFKNKLIVCRKNDTGSTILPDIPKLDYCMPTAVNAGLSIATDMKFDKIYLFGTDVGYWDEKNHHSKSSAYYDKNTPHFKAELPATTKSIKSNFREENILTNDGMYWCKTGKENCIKSYFKNTKDKTTKFYNCSDGAFIEATIPLRAKDIPLRFRDKDKMLSEIKNAFITNSQEIKEFRSEASNRLINEKKLYIKDVDTIIKQKCSTTS